jgi:solute carrier family 25 folate transporter 32
VVRTRLQDLGLKYAGATDCIRRTYRGEGLRGFYKGLAPNLLRVVPATMITFLVYENVSHYMLKRRRSDSDQPAGV